MKRAIIEKSLNTPSEFSRIEEIKLRSALRHRNDKVRMFVKLRIME